VREFVGAGITVVSYGSRDIDLCEPSSADLLLTKVGSADALFFAAVIPPRKGRDRPTMLRNIQMADTVCRFLERSPCAHLIYMSTDNVFAADEATLHEQSRFDPVDLYGLGHFVRERLLGEASVSAGVPYLVLRTGPIYGPGNPHGSYGPDRFLRTALRDGVITLFGGGEEIRHHLLVFDFAHAVRLLAGARATGVVHVAPPVGASFREVASIARDLVGPHVRLEERPRSVPLRHRFHAPRGWPSSLPPLPYTPLRAGLARTLAAMKEEA